MRVFFMPLACSLAVRIACLEASLDAGYVEVSRERLLPDGRSYAEVNPLGYVPAIELGNGMVLREGIAALEWLVDHTDDERLGPASGTPERDRMREWLAFVATELHQGIFNALMSRTSNDGAREFAMSRVPSRFGFLDRALADRETLLERFTVADAYLVAVLNWCEHAGLDLSPYPAVRRWRDAMRARPSVARAIETELQLLRT